MMEVFQSTVYQTTEEHGLRAGGYEIVFAEDHVLARTLIVVKIIAGIRVVFGEVFFFKFGFW